MSRVGRNFVHSLAIFVSLCLNVLPTRSQIVKLTVNITGDHSLFIYVIGDPKKNVAMVRSGRRGTPPMVLNIDVMSPSVLLGIEPLYIGHQTFRGGPLPHSGKAIVG